MKYLVIGSHINEIIAISDDIAYQENGNPLVYGGTLAIASILVKSVEEVENVPDGVTAMNYCYANGEYSLNPEIAETY